jgi:1,4-alpha-glucan branching enzyme
MNLDGSGSDEVRRFLCDNALMWFRDYHLDGLRLGAVHALIDTSATSFLEQLAEETDALAAHLGRPLMLIAESDLNDPRLVRSPAVGGIGLDAQWNDDFHHALHAVLTGERDGYYQDLGLWPTSPGRSNGDSCTKEAIPFIEAGVMVGPPSGSPAIASWGIGRTMTRSATGRGANVAATW